MLNINPTYNPRVRYELRAKNLDSLVVTEPEGWRSDGMEFQRHEQYHGIFPVFSENLKFVDNGADYITLVKETQGVQAELQLVKDEMHPHTGQYVRTYSLNLDLSTYNFQDGTVSIKINSSGIEQDVKSRDNEKIEIERADTIDGSPLDPIANRYLLLDGRKIFLRSELINSEENTISTNSPYNSPPLHKEIDSDELVVDTFEHIDGTWFVGYNPGDDTQSFPQDQQFFYFRSDRSRTLHIGLDIQLNISFNLSGISNQFWKIRLQKSKYVEGGEATHVAFYTIATINGSGSSAEQTLSYNNANSPFEVDLLEDECLCLVYQFPQSIQGFQNHITPIYDRVIVTEDSEYPHSWTKVIFGHELAERIVEIITNKKGAFYSKALGRKEIGYASDGFASFTAHAHGHWVRLFAKEPENDDNKYKPFSISWKQFIQSYFAIWDLGMGIEKNGYQEKIRIESIKDFYRPVITIRLPNQVTGFKRYYDTSRIFSAFEIGYEKGGEYEEAMGLDEYNGKSNFISNITRVKNSFNAISSVRADSYGVEFIRRKPRGKFPTTDTNSDSDVFAFHSKKLAGANLYALRKWQDDFEQAPTGVYSPETAYNLLFSPSYLMQRHGWEIGAGLTQYPNEKIKLGSSTANSRMTTKLIGGQELSQNTPIKNSELGRARYVAEWIEFEHPVDFDVHEQLTGTTVIGAEREKISNLYGLVEFTYKEQTYRGFLFNVKPNGDGKWKVLKFNDLI